MNHSPEPWKYEPKGHQILDANGQNVIYGDATINIRGDPRLDETLPNDLRRIVLCVNELAGMPDEVLESGAIKRLVAELLGLAEFVEACLNQSRGE